MLELKVKKEEQGQKIDKYIRKQLSDAPLSFIYHLFRKKDVKVNGLRIKKDYIIKENDQVNIYVSEEQLKDFKNKPKILDLDKNFKIIYEDDNVLIVDKPVGLVINPDEKEKNNTLANQVQSYYYKKGLSEDTLINIAPAHRLDRNTSGLVIFGKSVEALQELNSMFKTRKGIKKYYQALTFNRCKKEQVIEVPLLKDEKKKEVIVDTIKGQKAISIVRPIFANDNYSLVEVEILTGRTHQIRVHLSYIGLPIVGDNKYGDFSKNKDFISKYKWNYQFLHAYKLVFEDIDGKLGYLSNRVFTSSLPDDKKAIIDKVFEKSKK